MNVVKQWFDEAVKEGVRVYSSEESEYLIYKGFKITKNLDNYVIHDVRRSDFYDPLKHNDYITLQKLGFIFGCDSIVHSRNKRRVLIYTRRLEKIYTNRRLYESKLKVKSTRAFYEKKIRNCQENIRKNIDLLFFYKSKVEQHELKYNNNEKIKNKTTITS